MSFLGLFTMQKLLLLVFLVPTTSSFRLFSRPKKVCYGDLGCFGNGRPFINTLGFLPKDPSVVFHSFTLYTRSNTNGSRILNYGNTEGVTSSGFLDGRGIKILVHGYIDSEEGWWVHQMKDALLDKGDFNVIVTDWRTGADDLYQVAAANTRVVGAIVAKLLTTLNAVYSFNMKDVHLIGHSLGAHVSGYVGTKLQNIGRITGLDPAAPLFENYDNAVKLDPSDAGFVDVIHTNARRFPFGFGTRYSSGHIDFYPNGGYFQPGCPTVGGGFLGLLSGNYRAVFKAVICSHSRALNYFIESLTNKACEFTAYPCSSYSSFKSGQCTSCGNGPCPIMGYDSDLSGRRGDFYLRTNEASPFCART